MPPPRNIKTIELAAVLKILGMATSSLRADAVYALPEVGGVKLTRPSILMQACMVRAANKTLNGIDCLAAELQHVATEVLQLAKSCAGELRPEGWDSEAFCTNLANAKQGKLGTSSIQGGQTQLKLVIEHFGLRLPGFAETRRSAAGGPKGGLQSHVYKHLLAQIPSPWKALLDRKFSTLCPGIGPRPHPPDFDNQFAQIIKQVGLSISMCLIKTWANSWSTSEKLISHK